ncbi:hypothetical protein V1477_016633, partial [Vespula maculifrons]
MKNRSLSIKTFANDENAICPKATNIIERNYYDDDLIMDTHIFDDAIRIRDRILDIASKDGFVLRQWASNEKSLISDFVNYLANTCICLNLEEITFTLG